MLVSVNVGLPAPLDTAKGRVLSGIVKRPVAGRVAVHPLGLEGDGQADLTVHGGPEQALYAYPHEHYAAWAAELGAAAPGGGFPPGWFGENLTVPGALETAVRIGDTSRAGTALLQVTKPRSPCFKLAAKTGRPDFAKLFLASGRTGYYLRVLEEGEVGAGDAFVLVSRDENAPTVLDDARRRWGTPESSGTKPASRNQRSEARRRWRGNCGLTGAGTSLSPTPKASAIVFPIVEARFLAPDIKRFRVIAPRVARKQQAGQFVIVRLHDHGERIPLTFAGSNPKNGTIVLTVQGVGKTTRLMNLLKTRPTCLLVF